jgi:hypothetical protein
MIQQIDVNNVLSPIPQKKLNPNHQVFKIK